MGIAIANQAKKMGANVKVIYTKRKEDSLDCKYIYAPSADEILIECKKNIKWADIFICAAAISDFKVKKISNGKIKKTDSLSLELIKNIDVIKEITKDKNRPFCVGFAAEDKENLKINAARKLVDKKLDLIAANVIDVALGTEVNQLNLFDKNGFKSLPLSNKTNQAFLLLKHISNLFKEKNEQLN
jgi:phosphopantothenoylcysteine decarboxylase/phosphopantothenate--cysteine ligase